MGPGASSETRGEHAAKLLRERMDKCDTPFAKIEAIRNFTQLQFQSMRETLLEIAEKDDDDRNFLQKYKGSSRTTNGDWMGYAEKDLDSKTIGWMRNYYRKTMAQLQIDYFAKINEYIDDLLPQVAEENKERANHHAEWMKYMMDWILTTVRENGLSPGQ